MSLLWYKMDFPKLIENNKCPIRKKKTTRHIPTPNVFELTETALVNLEAAGVKYR